MLTVFAPFGSGGGGRQETLIFLAELSYDSAKLTFLKCAISVLLTSLLTRGSIARPRSLAREQRLKDTGTADAI
jgi:hypothetical protein